jgi:predicted metal-dependent phosphoesterase TrpH
MSKIDLHIHTTASDGVFTPSEVVQIALERSLSIIAITDHDSVDGVVPAMQAAHRLPLEVIPGIEMGIENGPRDIHVLGYGLDPRDVKLNKRLRQMRDYRYHRMEEMVAKLNAHGVPVTAKRIREIAAGDVIARPHIAQAIIEIGVVADMNEAFERFIGNDRPCYVPRLKMQPVEGIRLIHEAGGVAVVAHPGRYTDPLGVVNEFVGYGIDGVEVYYPDNSSALRQDLHRLAAEHNLIVTGGCDFHRPASDGSLIMGCEDVPLSVVDNIQTRMQRYTS